jgi:YCII-related domain-containing protein
LRSFRGRFGPRAAPSAARKVVQPLSSCIRLGRVLIFDCKDLDEAILWASKVPDAQNGCVELRPIWEA